MREITDPKLLAELNGLKEVTDPGLLAELEFSQYHPSNEAGAIESALIAAGRTFDKLGAGAQDLYYQATGDKKAQARIEADQKDKDRHFKKLEKRRPVSTFVGGALPYMPIPGGAATSFGRAAATGAVQGGVAGLVHYDEDPLSGAVGGAIGGGVGAAAGRMLGRTFTNQPVPASGLTPQQQTILQRGEQIGLQATPADKSGSRGAQLWEAGLKSNPFTQGVFVGLNNRNQEIANRVVSKSFGENSDNVSGQTINQAFNRLGAEFENLTKNASIKVDDDFVNDLVKIQTEALPRVGKNSKEAVAVISQVFDAATEKGKILTGKEYRQLGTDIRKAMRTEMRKKEPDYEYFNVLNGARDALDNMMERSLKGDSRSRFKEARRQFANLMLAVNERIIDPGTGNVRPRMLGNVLERVDRRNFMRGTRDDDLAAVARFGQAFKDPVGDSGTATRMALNTLLGSGMAVFDPSLLLAPAAYRATGEAYMRYGWPMNGAVPVLSPEAGGLLGQGLGGIGGGLGLLGGQSYAP